MGWEGVKPPVEPAGYDPANKYGAWALQALGGVAWRATRACHSAKRQPEGCAGCCSSGGAPTPPPPPPPTPSAAACPFCCPAADPVKYFQHREAQVAEEYVKVAEAKVGAGAGMTATCREAMPHSAR